MKEITSLNVVKIGNEYHKVFNAYHFTNNDGFKQTDLTLEEYPRVKLEEDLWQKRISWITRKVKDTYKRRNADWWNYGRRS